MAGITLRLFVFQVPASYVNSLVRSRPVTSTALSLGSLLECKRRPRPQRRSVPAVTSPRRWDPVLGYWFDFLFDSGIFQVVFIKPDSKRTMLSNIFNENTGEDSMWIIRGHEPRERTSRHWH